MDEITPEDLKNVVLPKLSPESSLDVKLMALDVVHIYSTSNIHRQKISGVDTLKHLVAIYKDTDLVAAKKALAILVNLLEDPEVVARFLEIPEHSDFGSATLKQILNPDFEFADMLCMALSNMTRFDNSAELVAQSIFDGHVNVAQIVQAITHLDYNKKNAHLNHLPLVLCNLTQIGRVRMYLLDAETKLITKIIPFLSFENSVIRRKGCAGIVRNCCFESAKHEWLLSEDVDLLPALLLPLAGPEEFDDEDNEGLPLDLQYLPASKTRECDADIRKMLVESVFQLCATKPGRLYVKKMNTYIIMRELHKWETDPANDVAIQNLVDILIGDEPEEGLEDLKKVDIPDDLEEKFQKEDEEDLEDINKARAKKQETKQ